MRDYVALIGLSLRFLCLVIFVSQKCTDMLFFVCLVVYPIVYPFSGSSRRCYCWRMKMISAGAGFLPRNCCILRPSIFRYFMIIYLFFDIHHHSFPLKKNTFGFWSSPSFYAFSTLFHPRRNQTWHQNDLWANLLLNSQKLNVQEFFFNKYFLL